MGQMRPSNYEIMRDRMEVEFAKHDQANMIQKFHLQHDADFLYIRFAAREYRINRKNGRVEWYSAAKAAYIHADYTVSMTNLMCLPGPGRIAAWMVILFR